MILGLKGKNSSRVSYVSNPTEECHPELLFPTYNPDNRRHLRRLISPLSQTEVPLIITDKQITLTRGIANGSSGSSQSVRFPFSTKSH